MCTKSVLFTRLHKDAGQQNIKFTELFTTACQQRWYIVIQCAPSILLHQDPAYIFLQFMPRSFECCIFFRDSPPKSRTNFSPCVPHTSPTYECSPSFDRPNICQELQNTKLLFTLFCPVPYYFIFSSSAPYSRTFSAHVLLWISVTRFRTHIT